MANKVERKPGGKNLAVVPNRNGPFIMTAEGRVYTTFTVVELTDAEAKRAHERYLKKYGPDDLIARGARDVGSTDDDEIE